MNWESGEEPKNSLIAAVTGRMLIRLCGVDDVQVLGGHALADDALHAGETDAELVLQQLAHATQAAVAEVVDVIHHADAVAQVQQIADGSEHIVDHDGLGDQVVDTDLDGLFQLVARNARVDDLLEDRKADFSLMPSSSAVKPV